VIAGRETAVRIASKGPSLEGALHLPEGTPPFPGVLVCHPHPQFGGDMYNHVVGALVRAATGAGYAALRFNFRGVGRSEGQYAHGDGEVADVAAAVNYLRTIPEVDAGKLMVAGYSFGAMMALRYAAGRSDLAGVVAVSMPTDPRITELTVDSPLLLVTGDADPYCEVDLARQYVTRLGSQAELEVVEGLGHFWEHSLGRLEACVSDFISCRK
jgi:alpha/beta superfamily hydrolase